MLQNRRFERCLLTLRDPAPLILQAERSCCGDKIASLYHIIQGYGKPAGNVRLTPIGGARFCIASFLNLQSGSNNAKKTKHNDTSR